MSTLNLSNYYKMFSNYTELRVQNDTDINITFLNSRLINNTKNIIGGVSARVFMNGSWGFASCSEISSENIKEILKIAKENAKILSIKENNYNNTALSVTTKNYSFCNEFTKTNSSLTQNDLIDYIENLNSYIKRVYPKIKNIKIGLKCSIAEKQLLNTNYVFLNSTVPRTGILIDLSLENKGDLVGVSNVFGGLGNFEDHFRHPSELYREIDILHEHLVNKSEGIYTRAEIKDVILDSDVTGTLAHEAVGHTTEADLVSKGSIAQHYLEKPVASSLITLMDFANSYRGDPCPVPVYIDDEGTKAEDTLIIENGILKGFMHNKLSAIKYKSRATGHGRSNKYFHEPLIRMRNTAILPGKNKLEDMISSIQDGYYLIKSSNGQADINGEFMFGIILGYEIKNGKLGRGIKDTTISGVAFDVLNSVSMVSDSMKWISAGKMCSKKQLIDIGMGGPAIKCKVNIGGR